MSRSYHEQVEVRLGSAREHGVRVDGALPAATDSEQHVPSLFLWRGRLHVVRVVLAQWSQRVPWWRSDDDEPDGPWSGLERVIWRVEADVGRSGSTGVYDLAQGRRWWLERVTD